MTISQLADRCRQTSLTTGLGPLVLGAVDAGYRSLSSAYAQDVDLPYAVEGLDAGGDLNGQWEVGRGHLNGSGQLVRDAVYASSNANFAVSFTATSLRVFVTGSAAGLGEWFVTRPLFTVTVRGLVPPPATIAGKYLRDDGSWQPLTSLTPRQESVTTQNVTGTDTALTDLLDNAPVSNASVTLFLNGVFQRQGAGADYSISGQTITWLAASGTAVDMTTGDVLVAVYSS